MFHQHPPSTIQGLKARPPAQDPALHQRPHAVSPPLRTGFPRLIIIRLILLFTMGSLLTSAGPAKPQEKKFSIGFSSNMFINLNQNDATAAIKLWAEAFARKQAVPTAPLPFLLKDMDALFQSLQTKQADAVGITAMEYRELLQKINFSPLLTALYGDTITEKYVLLVQREGAIKTIADLKERRLAFHTNIRTCLAPLWLDSLLITQGHPPATRFAERIFHKATPAKTVLPVFFGNMDACVITRRGFDTMAELNPQLARELIPLAESPGLIPCIFAFRADYDPVLKKEIISSMKQLTDSPAGRQTLTIFQCNEVHVLSAAALDTTLKLIDTYNHLVTQELQP